MLKFSYFLFLIFLSISSNAQVEVFIHQKCHSRAIGVINHPEIIGTEIDNETTRFIIPTQEEPMRISFHIDTVGFKIERMWIDSSTKIVDLTVFNCSSYRCAIENANILTKEERINGLYFDYLAQKYGDDKDLYLQKFNAFIVEYIKNNPDSFLSLNYISKFTGKDSEIAELLKIVEPTNSRYPSFQKMKNRIVYKNQIKINSPIPDFESQQINEQPFSTFSLKNKATLVFFWQSGCRWSVKSIPKILEIQEKYANKGVEVIFFNLDENKALWKENSTKFGIKDINISDGQGFYGKTPLSLGVSATPYFFLLDKEKKIQLVTFGDETPLVERELIKIIDQK
jgi:thiol-disulfide isomerase/thioredoxin